MDMSVFKKLADDADRQLKTMNTQLLPKECENLLLLESNLHLEKLLEEMTKRAEKAERELKVAIDALVGQCKYCRKNQECTSRKGPHIYCWEWRGAKEE